MLSSGVVTSGSNTVNHAAILTGNTFTKNSAMDGGGVFLFNDTGSDLYGLASTVQYNRFLGNTATVTVNGGTRTGLAVENSGDTNTFATVTASDNFWGCNTGANTTNCDSARAANSRGTLTLTPYMKVTAAFNPASPIPGQTVTLVGSLNSDSNGTTFTGQNLNAFSGVAETSFTVPEGNPAYYTGSSPGGTVTATLSLTDAGSSIGYSSGTALSTAAQAGVSGTPYSAGTLTGTVTIDNATVTVNATLTIQPPTISIAFSPTSTYAGGTSTLTFTLVNLNTQIALNGVAFSGALPSGLVVGSVMSNTCSGTVMASAGSGTISLSGVSSIRRTAARSRCR